MLQRVLERGLMAREREKEAISPLVGTERVRILTAAGLSRTASLADLAAQVGGGLDLEQLDEATKDLIEDSESQTGDAINVRLDTKVDKTTDANKVYGTAGDGSPTTFDSSLFLAQPNWLGNWDIGTGYVEGDLVRYTDNAVYIALQATTGDAPDSSALDWDLFIPAPVDGVTPDTSYVFQQIIYDGSWPDRDTLPFAGPVMWINPTNDTPPNAGDPYFIDGDLVVLNIA